MSAALAVSAHHPAAEVLIPVKDLDNRLQWLAARRQGVTSTDSRVLMAVGYKGESIFGRWLDKVEPADEELTEDQRERFELGLYWEPYIQRKLAERFAIGVAQCGMLRSKRWPTLLANPDGNTSDGGNAEYKRTSTHALKRYQDDTSPWTNVDGWTLPAAWRVQAQHHLLVSGRSHCYVAGLVADRDSLTYWVVQADQREQDILRELAGMFWQHVIAGEAPPVEWDRITEAEIKKRWPDTTRDRALADDVTEVRQLIAARARLDRFVDERKAIDLRLKAIAADAGEIVDENGEVLFRHREQTRRSLDAKALERAHPDLVSEFQRVTRYRSLWVPAAAEIKLGGAA